LTTLQHNQQNMVQTQHLTTLDPFRHPSIDTEPEDESLRDVMRVLRKRRQMIVGTLVGCLLLSLAVSLFMRPVYNATATIEINKDNSSSLSLGSMSDLASGLGSGDDLKTDMQTQTAVLENDTIALRVIQALNLTAEPPFRYEYGKKRLIGGPSDVDREQGLPLDKAPATRQRLLGLFKKEIEVQQIPNTRLLQISLTNPDPDVAARIANAVVSEYINNYLETRYSTAQQATDWMSQQLGDLKKRVQDSQQKLADYERKTGLITAPSISVATSPDQAGTLTHNPTLDKLDELNKALTGAEADRIAVEAVYRLTQTQNPEVVLGLAGTSFSNTAGASALISGNALSMLQALQQQEAALKVQYADAATKYGAKNPKLAELQNQIGAIDSQVHEEIAKLSERAHNQLLIAQQTENGLQDAFNKQTAEVQKVNDSTVQLEVFAQEAASDRQLYEDLYTKLQEATVDAGVRATNISIVDPARAPKAPTRPNYPLNLAIGIGVGLFLGISGAFFKEHLDDGISTSVQLEAASRLPVLGYVPDFTSDMRRKLSMPGDVSTKNGFTDVSWLISRPSSAAAESYRALRTSILMSSAGSPPRTILLTSALGGDGKSTTCYNLGVAFAHQGHRVLMVDADMRKPTLHKHFGASNQIGLSNVLTASANLRQAIIPHTSIENLFFLPSGTIPPRPAELLGSRTMSQLIEDLKLQYDFLLFDSPPALLVTDPIVLSSQFEAVIGVVRAGKATRPVVLRLADLMRRRACNTVGLILNAVDTSSAEYYYSYGYYGGDGYYSNESQSAARGA